MNRVWKNDTLFIYLYKTFKLKITRNDWLRLKFISMVSQHFLILKSYPPPIKKNFEEITKEQLITPL